MSIIGKVTVNVLFLLGMMFISYKGALGARIPWESDTLLDVGVGINGISERAKSNCLSFSDNDFSIPYGGNIRYQEWNFSLVKDRKELERSLDVSATAKLSYGAGLVKGSVKSRFAEEQAHSTYSVYAVLNIKAYAGKKLLRMPKFGETTQKWLKEGKLEKFHEICGDEYIAAVEFGGEFFAVLEFHTSSEMQKKELERAFGIGLSGATWSGEASAALKEKIRQLTEKSNLKLRGFQIAGSMAKISDLGTTDGMIKSADEFINTVFNISSTGEINGASPYYGITQDYKYIPISEEVEPSYRDLQQQRQLIEKLDEYRIKIRDKLDNVDYVLLHPEEFEKFDENELSLKRSGLQVAINTLYSSAKACFAKPDDCNLPAFDIPVINLPKHIGELVYGPHETCGVAEYNTGHGPVCGEPIYISARSQYCGIEEWMEVVDSRCGVKLYNKERHQFCGVELYKEGMSGLHCKNGRRYITSGCYYMGNFSGNSRCRDGYDLVGTGGEFERQGAEITGTPPSYCYGDHIESYCRERTRCRHEAFGVELYKECRNSAFGVEEYNKCKDPVRDIGEKVFKECRHPNHGIEGYPTCQHSTFGVKSYKECWHKRG